MHHSDHLFFFIFFLSITRLTIFLGIGSPLGKRFAYLLIRPFFLLFTHFITHSLFFTANSYSVGIYSLKF